MLRLTCYTARKHTRPPAAHVRRILFLPRTPLSTSLRLHVLGRGPLDAVVRPDLGTHDVVPDDADPRVTRREVVVELGRGLLERGQARPRHKGEVVVLVVVADI